MEYRVPPTGNMLMDQQHRAIETALVLLSNSPEEPNLSLARRLFARHFAAEEQMMSPDDPETTRHVESHAMLLSLLDDVQPGEAHAIARVALAWIVSHVKVFDLPMVEKTRECNVV